MKKIVISCGPIPARLDAVKFITNRFKGGLAFKTARYLIDQNKYDVTVVIWKHTPLPKVDGRLLMDYWAQENVHVVTVNDVFEYYNWFKDNAKNYDGFILAAAVANLTPSNPWEGKFPSHNYKVGDKFDITFEIAPRAIDIIKEINPRSTLIGYKLFDAKDDDELVEIARHTLADSKANIIFANTPATAKERKLAIMPDNAVVPCDFDEHLDMIDRALNLEYFKTKIEPLTEDELNNTEIKWALSVVKMYDRTFPGFGTVAVPVRGTKMFATTARGHRGEPVIVRSVDFSNRIVKASGKATLNAPTLSVCIDDTHIVVHRHYDDPLFNKDGHCDMKFSHYMFPGTKEEASTVKELIHNGLFQTSIEFAYHGDLTIYPIRDVDWTSYYEDFPDRYFGINEEMQKFIRKYNKGETLELGANKTSEAKYVYDKYVQCENAINLDVKAARTREYNLVFAKNSINYFPKELLKEIISRTEHFIANTFLFAPDERIRNNEATIFDKLNRQMLHTLRLKDDSIACHSFNYYDAIDYYDMGLIIKPYGRNSALVFKGDSAKVVHNGK